MPGIFSQVRPAEQRICSLQVPDGMVKLAARRRDRARSSAADRAAKLAEADDRRARSPAGGKQGYGYWLLVVAGLGIFCGCVGKSAQFPLHVWLPDAMEGPTPVSALIHAATMVAAGVYLVGRFYPVFTPEVLLVIACVGCITLFIAATIALTATDIKRVLAYSTVSQLGYMMLALGVGGWLAGMFHLFTHAFFKSLLFLCSGSVIHACGTNEMPQMGGLRKKMPCTAWTMLVGCLAISGAGIPTVIGLSGYLLEGLHHRPGLGRSGPPIRMHGWLFYAAVAGAGMTAFYMFRLWYHDLRRQAARRARLSTTPTNRRTSMTVPLVILAVLARRGRLEPVLVTDFGLEPLLEQARPAGIAEGSRRRLALAARDDAGRTSVARSRAMHLTAEWAAFAVALAGFLLATAFYGLRKLDPDDARRTFAPLYRFLVPQVVVRRVVSHSCSSGRCCASPAGSPPCDKKGIDWLADNSARAVDGLLAARRLDRPHLRRRLGRI